MTKKLVIDSSILIALDRRGTLENYLKLKKEQGYQVLIPRAIARELTKDPKKYAKGIKERHPELAAGILNSVERMNAAVERGLKKIETVNYRKYSMMMDNVGKRLSALEAKPEHAVKKGDVELITLVIQLHDDSRNKVYISTKDKGLLKALKPFDDRVEYEVLEW